MKPALIALILFAVSCDPSVRTSNESVVTPQLFAAIDELTDKFNIERLRTVDQKTGDIEARVWLSCGLCASPTGYILRRADGNWSGIFLGYRDTDGELTARSISEPRGGWEKSWAKLDSHYISLLPDGESISCNAAFLDGERYQIEIRQGSFYRTYGYSDPEMVNDERCGETRELLAIYDILKTDYRPQD